MQGRLEDIGMRVYTTQAFPPTHPVAVYGGAFHDEESVLYMEQMADNQGARKDKTMQVEGTAKNGKKTKFYVDGTGEQNLMGLVFGRYDSKRFKFQSFIGYI